MDVSIARTAGDRWQAFMDAAAERVQLVAREGLDGEDVDCARQILQTPVAWSRWERELGSALRPVTNCRTRNQQVRALRKASFTWIHRAAPFRFLKNEGVRGQRRQRLVAALHGPFAHYDLALIAEHDRYQRSVCHGFCANHLGRFLLDDRLHGESMLRYQALYTEYFQTFGRLMCGLEGPLAAESEKLLPMMKHELAEMRHAILEYPRRRVWLKRQSTMRAPHGDTRHLQRLDFILN